MLLAKEAATLSAVDASIYGTEALSTGRICAEVVRGGALPMASRDKLVGVYTRFLRRFADRLSDYRRGLAGFVRFKDFEAT